LFALPAARLGTPTVFKIEIAANPYMVLILMYRRRSGIAASSVYPKKTNVAAPTTLVIVDTVFSRSLL